MSSILIFFVRLYKLMLSPLLPFNQCRFYPTCSQYTIDALQKYGSIKGILLSVKRIGSCHPYSKKGGFDPVP